jgi:hypothetical protein
MRKSRIIGVLRWIEADQTVKEVARELGVSEAIKYTLGTFGQEVNGIRAISSFRISVTVRAALLLVGGRGERPAPARSALGSSLVRAACAGAVGWEVERGDAGAREARQREWEGALGMPSLRLTGES